MWHSFIFLVSMSGFWRRRQIEQLAIFHAFVRTGFLIFWCLWRKSFIAYWSYLSPAVPFNLPPTWDNPGESPNAGSNDFELTTKSAEPLAERSGALRQAGRTGCGGSCSSGDSCFNRAARELCWKQWFAKQEPSLRWVTAWLTVVSLCEGHL